MNPVKEFFYIVRGHGLELDIKWADPKQISEIAEVMRGLFQKIDPKKGVTEWEAMKQKTKDKILGPLSMMTVYNSLSQYSDENKKIVADAMWYMSVRVASEMGSPFIRLVGYSELMSEKLIVDICNKNGPEFTRAITKIYENEWTDLMLPSYVMADANERVAYYAARALGNRVGEAAKMRLKTIVNYIDSMGNDSGPFSLLSGGNMKDAIDEAKRVLEGFIKEDEFLGKSAVRS